MSRPQSKQADQTVLAHVLSAMPAQARDLISGEHYALDADLCLKPYQVLWLQIKT